MTKMKVTNEFLGKIPNKTQKLRNGTTNTNCATFPMHRPGASERLLVYPGSNNLFQPFFSFRSFILLVELLTLFVFAVFTNCGILYSSFTLIIPLSLYMACRFICQFSIFVENLRKIELQHFTQLKCMLCEKNQTINQKVYELYMM